MKALSDGTHINGHIYWTSMKSHDFTAWTVRIECAASSSSQVVIYGATLEVAKISKVK